jgi:hypothetical protein
MFFRQTKNMADEENRTHYLFSSEKTIEQPSCNNVLSYTAHSEFTNLCTGILAHKKERKK